MVWVLVLAVLSATRAAHGILNTTSIVVQDDGWTVYPCLQVNHREAEIEPSMMGLWYAIEIINHREDPKHQGTQVSDICPKLSLYKMSPKQIKLIWTEKAGDIHFNFKMPDPENSGYWMVWGKQNGTMLNKVYDQFAGTVQVIEGQPSRLVLMFCSNNRTQYSVIMVRNITVPHDTSDMHRTLSAYGLPEYSTRQTCRDTQSESGSANQILPAVAAVLSFALILVTRLN